MVGDTAAQAGLASEADPSDQHWLVRGVMHIAPNLNGSALGMDPACFRLMALQRLTVHQLFTGYC